MTVGVALHIDGAALFWIVQALGALVMVWPAWRCVAWLRDRYAAKRSSELLITASAIWLLQALVLASSLSRERRSPRSPPRCRGLPGASRFTRRSTQC